MRLGQDPDSATTYTRTTTVVDTATFAGHGRGILELSATLSDAPLAGMIKALPGSVTLRRTRTSVPAGPCVGGESPVQCGNATKAVSFGIGGVTARTALNYYLQGDHERTFLKDPFPRCPLLEGQTFWGALDAKATRVSREKLFDTRARKIIVKGLAVTTKPSSSLRYVITLRRLRRHAR